MELIKFNVESEELYAKCLELRDRVLRKPHGRSVHDDDLSLERDYTFYGIVKDGNLIATVTVIDEGEGMAFMRSVAVESELQGAGIGSMLMNYAFSDLKAMGFTSVSLKARETAMKFYAKCGFVEESEKFYNDKISMNSCYMKYEF